tara:strand:- start:19963 stop:20355 length:393 start_codon:yes stop_codon:yes gene_type:complete
MAEDYGNPGNEDAEAEMPEEEEEELPDMGEGEELPAEDEELLEMGDEEGAEGEHASLEEGVSALIANWDPQTPEGEQYLSELQALSDQFAGEMGEMGGMDEMGGMGPIPTAPLGDMRDAAAARMKERGLV